MLYTPFMIENMFIQLIIAALLGALIGMERGYKRKPAGMKTYALVSLGAALFTILGHASFIHFSMYDVSFDPSRVISSIIVGVGFIGGGLILRRQFEVEGLTTAAGLWITAAVGAAAGMGMYIPAVFVTVLTLLMMHILRVFEERFIRK